MLNEELRAPCDLSDADTHSLSPETEITPIIYAIGAFKPNLDSSVLVIPCNNCNKKQTMGEKNLFYLAVQGTVHHGGRWGQQEREAAGHGTFAVSAPLPSLYSLGSQPGNGARHSGQDFTHHLISHNSSQKPFS